ncbi:MAG: protein kinase domain-containing protein [Myxococcota bacterium]
MSCPERSQLEALMRGELAPAVAAALREHAAGCDDCTAVLEQLEARPAVRSVGRYVLVAEVGRGGMGRVFRAFDPQLERTVAVKLVRSDRQSPTENQQLLGEARAMAKLAHPHLVTVFDSGEDGGEVYIAMEYLTGQTLAEWLRAPRSLSDVVRVFREAGAGLLAAHRAGLVHRDFKPANVLLHDGLAKVSDFGLAQPVDTRGRSDSAGTAEYMAPEQRSGFADARSDQYAFGRSLAEALRLQRAAAPWLERIVARATAREPAERFPSMVEVLDALSRDPSLVRRRLAATGAVVVALTLAVVAVWDARRRRQAECDGGDLRVAQEWSAERRAALERQLTSALAPDGARTELQALEDWANAWRGTRREVCVASRMRGDLSDELFTLETLCLDRQMAGFATVVARAAAGEVGVEALVGAISELPKVKDCTDAEALVFRTASESGLERRNAQPIRERLDQASALSQLGKEPEAEQLATEALELARASGARPVLSEALLLSGQLQQRAGEKVAARKLLDEAYALATAARHDVVAAHAAMDILVTYAGEPEALAATMLFANAAADRAGRTPFTEARWSYRLGQVFARQSRFAEAEPRFRRALELREQLFGPTAPATQAARTNLAITLEQQARFDEALALYRAVLASDEQLYGAESALATRDLATLASGLVAAHRLDEAVPLLETAKARLEQRGRLEAEALFDVINNLAVVHESQRRWKAALPLRRRLIEVTDDPELQVVGRALLGRVLLELGERREAEALSLEAKAELEKVRADHPDLVLPLTTLARLEADPHKAKASLQRALSLKEATDAEFLGDAEWALAALESGARGAELRAKALAHYQEANVVPPP